MRYNILFLGLGMFLFSFVGSAQTKIIAHESHGGEPASFSLEKEDSFGQPANFDYKLDSVIKYRQNKVIEIFHKGKCMSCRLVDTTTHPIFNDPQVSLDSMQSLFPDVVFVGFDKAKGKRATLRAGLDLSLVPFQNVNNAAGIRMLVIVCGLFFILLSVFLWKQVKAESR